MRASLYMTMMAILGQIIVWEERQWWIKTSSNCSEMFRSRSRFFVNGYEKFAGALGGVEYLRDLVKRVLQLIAERSPPQMSSCDGGLYVGAAGIGYAFYSVAESSELSTIREQCLGKAQEYMQVKLNLEISSYAA